MLEDEGRNRQQGDLIGKHSRMQSADSSSTLFRLSSVTSTRAVRYIEGYWSHSWSPRGVLPLRTSSWDVSSASDLVVGTYLGHLEWHPDHHRTHHNDKMQ